MNLGRTLEVIVIVLATLYFASQAHILAMRWHTRPYTQTVNRGLAYLILTGPHNSTRLRAFLLETAGEDVVRVAQHTGELGGSATTRITYDSKWPYGCYVIKGLFLSPVNYTVVEVWVRD